MHDFVFTVLLIFLSSLVLPKRAVLVSGVRWFTYLYVALKVWEDLTF